MMDCYERIGVSVGTRFIASCWPTRAAGAGRDEARPYRIIPRLFVNVHHRVPTDPRSVLSTFIIIEK